MLRRTNGRKPRGKSTPAASMSSAVNARSGVNVDTPDSGAAGATGGIGASGVSGRGSSRGGGGGCCAVVPDGMAPTPAPRPAPTRPSRAAAPTTPRMVSTSKPSRCRAMLAASCSWPACNTSGTDSVKAPVATRRARPCCAACSAPSAAPARARMPRARGPASAFSIPVVEARPPKAVPARIMSRFSPP